MQTENKKNSSGSLFTENSGRKKFSFTYFERLHIQKDFNKVFKNGLRLESKNVKILAYRRNDGQNIRRLGLVTAKRVGSPIIRNRTKRRLREVFRTNKYFFEPGLDLIFISRSETALLGYNSLKKIILSLLKGAELYNPK
jgi:ribonuclease P protein component